MSRKISTVLGAVVGLLAGMQNALADNNLFKGYAYHTPLENFTTAKGYYDCSAEIGGTARCIDDVDFVGTKFTGALIFSDGKLVMVSLVTPYEQGAYTKAYTTLSKTFMLISMTDDKTLLDLVDLAATSKSKEQYLSKASSYENVGLSAGNLTYTFLEGAEVKPNLRSALSMLAVAPDTARSADLIISGQGPETNLIMRFAYPKFEINKAVKEAQEPAEAF